VDLLRILEFKRSHPDFKPFFGKTKSSLLTIAIKKYKPMMFANRHGKDSRIGEVS